MPERPAPRPILCLVTIIGPRAASVMWQCSNVCAGPCNQLHRRWCPPRGQLVSEPEIAIPGPPQRLLSFQARRTLAADLIRLLLYGRRHTEQLPYLGRGRWPA